jgi:hypothetical protein
MKKLSLNSATYILVGIVILLAVFAVLVYFGVITIGTEGIKFLH